MAATDDSDIPDTGAVFTFGKSKFADNLPNKFWVKNDRVLQVACGDEHTALIAESGRVFMFGPNDWGQLGLGQENKGVNKPSCVKLLKHEKSKFVACGRSHTLISTDSGRIYSFGSNSEGQLGIKDVPDLFTPRCIESLEPCEYKMIGAGSESSVALTEDGRVFVWGDNGDGKLGLGDHVDNASEPIALLMDKPVVWIACGYYHTALITDDGKLYTMGEPDGGKLGLPEDIETTKVPQEVTAITEPVKWVACGASHTVAVTELGDCYVFGEGESGQLGLGTETLSTATPTHLKLPFKASRVYCGQSFTAVISEKGQLYTFGDGRHGKLAHGSDQFSNQYKPFHCKRFSRFNVDKVACGGCHMIVTARPKMQNGEVESDGEVDEMKTLDLKALSETINTAEGSPSLTRSLSAREKRRQEVQRSFSTMNQTLPALTSTKGLPALSATMPALKPLHSKVNGDPLNKSMVPSLGALPNGKTSDGESAVESEEESHEQKALGRSPPIASPRRVPPHLQNLEKPPFSPRRPPPRQRNLPPVKAQDGFNDGSEGDDESEEEGMKKKKHKKKHDKDEKKKDDEEEDEEEEDQEEVMELTTQLQNQIDKEKDGTEDEEEKAEKDDAAKTEHTDENENEKVRKSDEEKDEEKVDHSEEELEKDANEQAAIARGPVPVPRKKQEKKEDEEDEEEEEEEEDDEEEKDKEKSKKKGKKDKDEEEEEDEKKDKKKKKKKDKEEVEDDEKEKEEDEDKEEEKEKDKKDKKGKGKKDKKKKKKGKDEDEEEEKEEEEEDSKAKKKDKGKKDEDKKKKGKEEDEEEDEEGKDKDKKKGKDKKDKKKDKEKDKKDDKKKKKDKDEEKEDEEEEEEDEDKEKDKKKDKKDKKDKDKDKKDKDKKKDNDKNKDENQNNEKPVQKKSRTCTIL